MIHQVLFFESSSGICFYSRDYTGVEIPEHLFTGIIKSIRDLTFEISKKDLKSIEMGDWLLYYVGRGLTTVVLICDYSDDRKIIQGKINLVADRFSEKFKDHIENFNGEISVFDDFKEDCDEVFFADWNFEFEQRVKKKSI
ncbi:MAG: hypothetical protein EAX96_16830 [Candidatus Lokiarchaeota archaeon]|nr:hypothetical protein [Candidatus Lokiarchaeota archaeon]